MKPEENNDHEFCLRCGRKLKNPRARRIGFGAVCERKAIREYEKSRQLFTADGDDKK